MPQSHGRFVWHDLSTPNPEAAQTFYTQIAHWKTQPSELSSDYVMWTNNDEPLGGVVALKEEEKAAGIRPQWLPYVCVYDVDACTRQVKSLGGTVRFGPNEVPTVGCWSVISDPFGATIGLYEPEGKAPGSDGQPRRGEFSWHELMTTDSKAAGEFYRALFGWQKISEFDMGDTGMYHEYGKNGRASVGIFNRSPDMPPPSWWSYIRVDEVKKVVQDVTKLGGTVMREPQEVPGGDLIAICTDPQGVPFALHTTSL